jgi:hypothetical protein
MKLESPSFTDADLDRFLDETWRYEIELLARRLEAVSDRLTGLAARMADAPEPAAGDAEAWSANETLAHVASLSRYYGALAYKVARGDPQVEWLNDVRGRDVNANELATHATPAELVAAAQTAHRRTVEWLRSASTSDLTRRERIGEGRTFSAEEIIRLSLCAHLEQHVEQIERALQPVAVAP